MTTYVLYKAISDEGQLRSMQSGAVRKIISEKAITPRAIKKFLGGGSERNPNPRRRIHDGDGV